MQSFNETVFQDIDFASPVNVHHPSMDGCISWILPLDNFRTVYTPYDLIRHSFYPGSGYGGGIPMTDRFRAIDFTGSNSYIPTNIYDISGVFTFLMWVKRPEHSAQALQSIVAKHGSFLDIGFACGFNDSDNYGIYTTTNGSEYHYMTTTNPSDTGWHHVAFMYDGKYKRIYVDGVLGGSEAYTGAVYNAPGPVTFGGIMYTGILQYTFQGLVSDIRIYKRALSEAEVIADYEDTKDFDYTSLNRCSNSYLRDVSQNYTTTFRDRLLDLIFGCVNYVPPISNKIFLSTTHPTGIITEPESGYHSTTFVNNQASWPLVTDSNKILPSSISFGPALGDWGGVQYIGVEISGYDPLFYDFGSTIMGSGDDIFIPANGLQIVID